MKLSGFFVLAVVLPASCIHVKRAEESGRTAEKKESSKIPVHGNPSAVLSSGLSLFKRGKILKARSRLEQLNYDDEGFVSAVLEIQKINYIKEDWKRFFGLAFYYRKKLLSSHRLSLKNFRQEILALEILALLRHCRFVESSKIAEWSLALAKRLKRDSSQIDKTAYFFKLQVGDSKKPETDWKRQINFWPVPPARIKWLNNPKRLRAKVKNQC